MVMKVVTKRQSITNLFLKIIYNFLLNGKTNQVYTTHG